MRIDEDLKGMTESQLRQEVMRFRRAFRKELNHTGNQRCWVTLMEALEGRKIKPLEMSRDEWLGYCGRYHGRNTKELYQISDSIKIERRQSMSKKVEPEDPLEFKMRRLSKREMDAMDRRLAESMRKSEEEEKRRERERYKPKKQKN